MAKDELDSALGAAKESDGSLTIDIDELLSQLDANGDGSLDLEETAALAPPPPPPPAATIRRRCSRNWTPTAVAASTRTN